MMYTDRHLDNLWRNGKQRGEMRYQQAGSLAEDMMGVLEKQNTSKLARLKSCWMRIVGEELEGLCFPLKFKSSILTIAVYNSDVRFYLEQFHRHALIERVEEISGESLRDVKCVVDEAVRSLQ